MPSVDVFATARIKYHLSTNIPVGQTYRVAGVDVALFRLVPSTAMGVRAHWDQKISYFLVPARAGTNTRVDCRVACG